MENIKVLTTTMAEEEEIERLRKYGCEADCWNGTFQSACGGCTKWICPHNKDKKDTLYD